MEVHHDLAALPRFRRAVVTIGSFDGVHVGHRALIRRIRQLADEVDGETVLVTFDPHPRHVLPTSRPPVGLLTSTLEKSARMQGLGVDHLVVVPFTLAFAAQTARQYLDDFLFGRFDPHTVVIGYDHRYGAGRAGDIALLRERAAARDIHVREIAEQDVDEIAVSSTRIREAVSAGRIATANTLLADVPYALLGTVIHGDAIGRTIGFPTANLELHEPYKLLPGDGVYAVRTTVTGSGAPQVGLPEDTPSMLYIGRRPSLEGLRARSIEVNVLDFSGDLYGRHLRVDVIARVRGDQQFGGLEALRAQIERDREASRKVLAA